MKKFRPNVYVDDAVTVIVIGFVPSKLTTTCCPEFSPHKIGTFDEPPVIDIMSVLQKPSPSGGARDKSKKWTRNWHTVALHGFTVSEHLESVELNDLNETINNNKCKIQNSS